MNLLAFITPQAYVARSVNLERDQDSPDTLSQYRLTEKGLEILNRFVAALAGEPVTAWSVTGPYGMGKSSFARFLLALCGPQSEASTGLAWRILERKNPQLPRQLHHLMRKHKAHSKGFFRVGVTSSFESLNRSLLRGLINAFRRANDEVAFGTDLLRGAEILLEKDSIETSELAQLLISLPKRRGTPVVVVIDEFGKNLEYMARFPAQGDLFILQILAEASDIYLWVCLHQAFEEYASRLSQKQIHEWAKIQGRFEDISFVEPRQEMLGFIGETLIRKDSEGDFSRAVRHWAEEYAKKARNLNLGEFQGMDIEAFESFYPLHPLSAVLLPELCVRFAQNDRTLFAFLCSGEPAALPAFLSKARVNTTNWMLPTFGPERLYDYFLSSASATLMGRPEAQRWIEIHDLIERSRSADPYQLAVFKTIGLLNLVSGPSGFRASSSLLDFAFFRPSQAESDRCPSLDNILRAAQDKGVLIYREYADEYRLWEGSDFDIPKAIKQRRSLLAMQSLEKVLRESVSLAPLTASRHSFITGNLRHFERRWVALDTLAGHDVWECTEELDGLILYVFGKEPAPSRVPSLTRDGRPVLVCYVPCEEEIREAVLDYAAIRAVMLESPELARDGVARKEAAFRAQKAEERLLGLLETIFVPGNLDAQWFVLGRFCPLKNDRDLSMALSECCDRAYQHAPRIRNELINRDRLSTAAARARRELLKAMVTRTTQAMLGFKGTGPEVAIYRTMLLQEGFHRQGPDGAWFFSSPKPDSSYRMAWDFLHQRIIEAGDAEVRVTTLIDHLKRPPFGLKEGPIPVLLCLYLMVESDEIALYQDGVFAPRIRPEDIELFSKRPELFSFKKVRVDETHVKVLHLYDNLLRARLQGDTHGWRNPSLLAVVFPLMQFVKDLPKYTLQTHRVSPEAQQVRKALLLAQDPFDLLYIQLPQAVGVPPFNDETSTTEENLKRFQDRFSHAVAELRQAYTKLLHTIEILVRKVFYHTDNVSTLSQSLQERAKALLDWCGDSALKPFVKMLAEFSGDLDAWLESIATLVTQRPIRSWRDDDLKNFAVALADMAQRFNNLETMVQKLGTKFPTPANGRMPRMVTLTYPNGKSCSRVLWHDDQKYLSVVQTVHQLLTTHRNDRLFLETLFITLGQELLAISSEEDQDDAYGY